MPINDNINAIKECDLYLTFRLYRLLSIFRKTIYNHFIKQNKLIGRINKSLAFLRLSYYKYKQYKHDILYAGISSIDMLYV